MTGVVLSTSHCELEPCLVGEWERGRIAGCLGVGITTGWGETEVFMGVSSRRLAIVQHRHPPARGLLSLISLLSAFSLTGINRNQSIGGYRTNWSQMGQGAWRPRHLETGLR